jgi:lysophospholipase L1-like esterase
VTGLHNLLWWTAALLLLPFWLPLALYTRMTALRLPEAAGPQQGLAGVQQPGMALRLLLVGESPVAGVGVDFQQQALAGQLAEALAQDLGRPVAWRALGENGITAPQACVRLLPALEAEAHDLVLLVFGVNDSTRLSALSSWGAAIRQLGLTLAAGGCRVAFTAPPPIERFTALPWLLRQLLGWRARLLDTRLRQMCAENGVLYLRPGLEFSADYLAVDGYHPSLLGYRVWAKALARQLSEACEWLPATDAHG